MNVGYNQDTFKIIGAETCRQMCTFKPEDAIAVPGSGLGSYRSYLQFSSMNNMERKRKQCLTRSLPVSLEIPCYMDLLSDSRSILREWLSVCAGEWSIRYGVNLLSSPSEFTQAPVPNNYPIPQWRKGLVYTSFS
jgi:hypothetical protein